MYLNDLTVVAVTLQTEVGHRPAIAQVQPGPGLLDLPLHHVISQHQDCS